MAKSIYQLICDNIKDGVLEENFSAPDESNDSPIRWASGAMDGVYIFHMNHSGLNAAQTKEMARTLKAAARGDYQEADSLFFEWTKSNHAVGIIDELQGYVIDHAERLNPTNMHNTAMNLILNSEHTECVKIGLELLELFGDPDESIKEIVRRVGLCDDFTIFAVWNMQKWNNGNPDIFELAKKVHGWGRIHAVERLEPETEEIRHWLLTEGALNSVMTSYSALTCWNKSNAEEVLFGKPTQEEFNGLSIIMEGLMDEGPITGISEIENAKEVLTRFVSIAPDYELTTADYGVILSIKDLADDEDEESLILYELCEKVLKSETCRKVIMEEVKNGDSIYLAEAIGIPYREQLYKLMEEDLPDNYYNVRFLLDSEEYFDKTLELFRNYLPFPEMEGDPIDDFCLGEEYKDYDMLQYILQELDDKPLLGIDFMKAGLKSPVNRNRYRSLLNLEEWVESKSMPLEELTPELFELVKDLKNREINDSNLKMINALIAGETEFSDDEETED